MRRPTSKHAFALQSRFPKWPMLIFSRVAANLPASASSSVAGAPASPRKSRGKFAKPADAFVGSIGCKSSSCHGGAGPKRSQYITWSQKDFHTKAFRRPAQCSFGTNRRRPRNLPAATSERALHGLPFAVPVGRAEPASRNRASGRRRFLRKLSRRRQWLAPRTYPTDWTYNTRVGRGHARSSQPLRAGQCLRGLPSELSRPIC